MKHCLVIVLCLLFAVPLRAESHAGYAGREDVTAFIDDMAEKHGFDSAALMVMFARTEPIPAVIKAISPPKDPAIRSWQTYRGRFVEPRRIAAGRDFRQQHAATLARAATLYGVPEEILLAIIGVETIYGRQIGRFNTFAALATLAFDYPPRASLFRGELEALLLLARDEKRDPLSYRSSFAGALGLPQFLPSSLRRWGVDFDNDGRVDLTASAADAIGSVGNFLQAHGWLPGGPIAVPVTVIADPQTLIEAGLLPKWLPTEMDSVAAPEAPAAPAALIDLVTPSLPTEYWLGYQNFYVLTRYNRSSFYAMAVFQLAQALKVAAPVPAMKSGGKAKERRRARCRRGTCAGAAAPRLRSVSGARARG